MSKTVTKEPTSGQLSPEQMRREIAAQEAAEAQACFEEVDKVLKRHGYEIVAIPQLAPDGRITATATLMRRGS